MPRFDNTGPEGAGPKTGRVLGKCRNSNLYIEEENWSFFGRGKGRGFGRGRGFRFWGRRNQGGSSTGQPEN